MKIFRSKKNIQLEPTERLEVPRISNAGIAYGQFEVCIPQGQHLQTGHVRLLHRAFYSVRLLNRQAVRCDAQVSIDGKAVGTWRIPANGEIEIERPADDPGKFTFYRLGSAGALAGGITETNQLGLVTVTFIPEVRIMFSKRAYDSTESRGGTGLSGFSTQEFIPAHSIFRDTDAAVTIHARLVAMSGGARPLRPLGTKVPPPLP